MRRPYALTLSPYGFFWFGLHAAGHRDEDDAYGGAEWAEQELGLFENSQVADGLVTTLPQDWLLRQRWFRGKAREIVSLDRADHALLTLEGAGPLLLVTLRVHYREGEPEQYLLPLGFRAPAGDSEAEPLVTYSGEAGEIRLYEALLDRSSSGALLGAIEQERSVASAEGSYRGRKTGVLEQLSGSRSPVRRIEGEQSNTSVIFGDQLILKVFRKLEEGENPDIEVTRFLTERTDFDALPRLAGTMEYAGGSGDGAPATVAGLYEFVANRGEAWSYTLRALNRYLAAASRSAADPATTAGREATRRMAGDFVASARALGTVTGRLHAALASAGDDEPDFVPEEISSDDVRSWIGDFQTHSAGVLRELGRRLESIPGLFPPGVLNELAAVVRDTPNILARMDDLRILRESGARQIRFHGDYHLGQLLRREGASPGAHDEWVVLDFEGEPARPLSTRRARHSPLRDVAGMLRSFNYAVRVALAEQDGDAEAGAPLESWGAAWEREIRRTFLQAYREAVAGACLVPDDEQVLARLLEVFELEKAIYELGYEMNNRPDWIWVPVQGIRKIMAEDA